MEIYAEYEITAPADEVWEVVGERFGDLRWSSGITDSYLEGELGVGAARVCHFPPNIFAKDGVVHEKLLSFDREAMQPLTIADARSKCTPPPNSMAQTSSLPPFIKPMLRRMGMKTLDELAEHVASRQQDERHTTAPQPEPAPQV